MKVRGRETVRMWVKVRDGEKGTVRVSMKTVCKGKAEGEGEGEGEH